MLEIRQLEKKDFNTARKFAIEGMHLYRYTRNNIELYLYSKYFWYSEISRATIALGAYIDNQLAGVLLADMKQEPKVFTSSGYKLFTSFSTFIIDRFFPDTAGPYDTANQEMLAAFSAKHKTDGELIFFAADPARKGHGIGSALLKELERYEKGKNIYLYTDSGCTFQFYIHRGFTISGRKSIFINVDDRPVPLTCFLFSKTL